MREQEFLKHFIEIKEQLAVMDAKMDDLKEVKKDVEALKEDNWKLKGGFALLGLVGLVVSIAVGIGRL